MSFLITGGASYIGSHVVRALALAGEPVVAYDDLSAGDTARVPDGVPFVQGSTLDPGLLHRTIAGHQVTTVIHLAARKQVSESLTQPLRYYRENLHGLQILLEAARANRVGRFVFSSSTAVYGAPDVELITEETPCAPTSPCGETMLAGEWLVRDAGRAYRMSTACLRHVNVAGAAAPQLADADASGLIPMTFEYLSAGAAPRIFGADYPTPDGTCVRDYLHAEDLAEALIAAAHALGRHPEPEHLTLNISRGEGVSVRQMIALISEVTGHERLAPVLAPRRPGDPARVTTSPDLAAKHLGWTARRDLRSMITSAWAGWLYRVTE